MGTWGVKALDNDAALDLKGEYEDSGDINVLKETLVNFLALPESDRDVDLCQEAVAVMHLWSESDVMPDQELIQLSLQCLSYILDNSELKTMWEESNDISTWSSEMSDLSAKMADKIKDLNK